MYEYQHQPEFFASMDDMLVLERLQDLLLDYPDAGYRSLCDTLQSEERFAEVGLKRVQRLLKQIKASTAAVQPAPMRAAQLDYEHGQRCNLEIGQVVYTLFDTASGVRFGDPGTVVEWPAQVQYDCHRYTAVEFQCGALPVLREHVSTLRPKRLEELFPRGSAVYYTKQDEDTSFAELGLQS
jgi:hypothetical protein